MAPLLYQVVTNAPSLLVPASVIQVRNLVLRGEVASPLYEWEVITPRYCSIPADTRFGMYLTAVGHPTGSQHAIWVLRPAPAIVECSMGMKEMASCAFELICI